MKTLFGLLLLSSLALATGEWKQPAPAKFYNTVTIGPVNSTKIHTINGGLQYTTNPVSGTYTIDNTTTDYFLDVSTSGARAITLPAPTAGRVIVIKDVTGGGASHNITISPHASETIDGVSSLVVSTAYGSTVLYSDGTNWFTYGGGGGGSSLATPVSALNGGTGGANVFSNNKVVITSGSTITESTVTTTSLGYLDATSSIQTQLNTKLSNQAGAYSALVNPTSATATVTAGQSIVLGTPNFGDTGTMSQFTGNTNSYLQNIIQNSNSGAAASSDFIVNNDKGTASTFYGDFGINSSGYTGASSLNLPNASYLYSQNGDLVVGTKSNNTLHLVTNSGSTDAMYVVAGNTIYFPPMSTAGILTNDSTGKLASLASGSTGYVLTAQAGGAPTWSVPPSTFIISPNLLSNSGWESDTSGWIANGGTYSRVTAGSSVGSGIGAGYWDSTAAGQALSSSGTTIPAGASLHSGVVSCNIRTSGAAATHNLQAYDGTNVLVSVPITSSTVFTRTSANFTIPAGGSVLTRISSVASNEPPIEIDDCFMGDATAFNMSVQQIAQDWKNDLTFTPPSGSWGTISNANFWYKRIGDTMIMRGTFTIGTPTGSNAQVTLPSGLTIDSSKFSSTANIQKVGSGHDLTSTTGGAYVNGNAQAIIYDGSDTSNLYFAYQVGSNTFPKEAANGFAAGDVAYLDATIPITQWSNTGTAYNPNGLANSWAGYHDNTCSWAITNASYTDFGADATCALVERVNNNFGTVSTSGGVKPAITFSPSRAGTYKVCAHFSAADATLADTYGIRLWDGTTTIAEADAKQQVATDANPMNLCGLYKATSVSAVTLSLQAKSASGAVTVAAAGQAASALEWEVFQVDQSFPMVNMQQASARYYGVSAPGLVTAGSTIQVTKYSTKDFDDMSAYSTASGAFTCPFSGKYEVSEQLSLTAATAVAATAASIFDSYNGIIHAGSTTWFATAATKPVYPQLNDLINCTAGSTISTSMNIASGTTPSIAVHNDANYLWIKYIGP